MRNDGHHEWSAISLIGLRSLLGPQPANEPQPTQNARTCCVFATYIHHTLLTGLALSNEIDISTLGIYLSLVAGGALPLPAGGIGGGTWITSPAPPAGQEGTSSDA